MRHRSGILVTMSPKKGRKPESTVRAWGSAAPDHILGLASLLRHLSQDIFQPMTAVADLPLEV